MLVLPEGETILVPPRPGVHALGWSSVGPLRTVSFGESELVGALPPESCWPAELKPLRAVVAEQSFTPYRPLAQKPYRIHLFFGDAAGMSEFRAISAGLVSLASDIDQAIFKTPQRAGPFGWSVICHSNDLLADEDSTVLDAWLCTIHWWAWKVTDSPIRVQPQVVLGNTAFEAHRTDQAVQEKLSFSSLDCDVFTATAVTIDLFSRCFDEPPEMAWATDYPESIRRDREHKERAGTSEETATVTDSPAIVHARRPDSTRRSVFISYSHKDKRWLDDLLTHLKPYLRDGSVTAWSDRQIATGSKWFGEIQAALASTRVAVLLVTPDFLASDFIHEHELGPLLNEAAQGGVRIVWVPVRACSYKKTPLKDYQAVIDPEKPLATMWR